MIQAALSWLFVGFVAAADGASNGLAKSVEPPVDVGSGPVDRQAESSAASATPSGTSSCHSKRSSRSVRSWTALENELSASSMSSARCFQAGISSRTARSRGSAARWVGRVEVSVIMVSPFMTRRVHLTFEVRGTGLVPFRHHLGRHRTQAVVLQARAPLPFSANKSPSGSPRTGLLRPPAWAEATRWRRGVRRLGAGG